jgi:mannose-1-phosphate guanylyltransferase
VTGDVYALVLAGGGGTRLWPASRRAKPKQFLPLLAGGQSLLGATVARLAPLVPVDRVMVVTARGQVDAVRAAVPELGERDIVIEPMARNTAACIGLGALEVLARDPNGIAAVVPSDQFVADVPAYHAAIERAIAVAAEGRVCTIGIKPSGPETGFGYIECGEAKESIARFVEKPDRQTAERYLASGRFLWNSGMFFFRARVMLDAVRKLMPALGEILDAIAKDPARAAELYPKSPAISIDYGVIEKLPVTELAVVPGDFGWNDVGSWAALPQIASADSHGNVAVGATVTVDCNGNLIYAGEGQLVAAAGVRDMVIVASGGAVLVLPRERAQDVREIVKALESSKSETWL